MNYLDFIKRIDTPERAFAVLKKISDNFQSLSYGDIKQSISSSNSAFDLYLRPMGSDKSDALKGTNHIIKECGACVGWWIAYFLNIHDKKDPNNYVYLDGVSVIVKIFEVLGYSRDLELLTRFGAHEYPFSVEYWDIFPK